MSKLKSIRNAWLALLCAYIFFTVFLFVMYPKFQNYTSSTSLALMIVWFSFSALLVGFGAWLGLRGGSDIQSMQLRKRTESHRTKLYIAAKIAIIFALVIIIGLGSAGESIENGNGFNGPVVAISAEIEIEPCTGQELFQVQFRSQSGRLFSYYTMDAFTVGYRYFLSGNSEGGVIRQTEIPLFDRNLGIVGQRLLEASQIAHCSVVHYSANAFPIVTIPTIPRQEVVLLPLHEAESLQLMDIGEILTLEIVNSVGSSWTPEQIRAQFVAVPIAEMLSHQPPSELQ